MFCAYCFREALNKADSVFPVSLYKTGLFNVLSCLYYYDALVSAFFLFFELVWPELSRVTPLKMRCSCNIFCCFLLSCFPRFPLRLRQRGRWEWLEETKMRLIKCIALHLVFLIPVCRPVSCQGFSESPERMHFVRAQRQGLPMEGAAGQGQQGL